MSGLKRAEFSWWTEKIRLFYGGHNLIKDTERCSFRRFRAVI